MGYGDFDDFPVVFVLNEITSAALLSYLNNVSF
jgi:hypothetical protein